MKVLTFRIGFIVCEICFYRKNGIQYKLHRDQRGHFFCYQNFLTISFVLDFYNICKGNTNIHGRFTQHLQDTSIIKLLFCNSGS